MINLEKLKSVRYPKKITEEEYNYLKELFPWIRSKKEGITCLRQNITEKLICLNPECDNLRKFNMQGTKGYAKGCCRSCTGKATMLEKYGVTNPGQLESSKEKVRKTVREKYGCDNVFQSEEIKEKSKKTMIKKHGVEFSSQRPEYLEMVKQTSLKRFGTESPMQNNEIKEKHKKTVLNNYGVENPSLVPEIRRKAENTMKQKYGKFHYGQTDEFKEKYKKICLEKYGVEHPMMNENFVSKIKKTNQERYDTDFIFGSKYFIKKSIERYGVENPIQCPEILENHRKKCFAYKAYKWESGEISKVQGNEPIILKELENLGYKFKDVLTNVSDMPKIWYEYNNKKRRYYPDIFIPKENKMIEVKSGWSLKLHWEQNQIKFQAVKDAGFNFQLEVR